MQTTLPENPRDLLARRLKVPRGPALSMTLRRMSWIHYAIPLERLDGLIPEDRFSVLATGEKGWISVVTFTNALLPGMNYRQTNLRTYVLDRATGEPAVWFFGFLTDVPLASLYRRLGGSPHEKARFVVDPAGYGYRFESGSGSGEAVVTETGGGIEDALAAKPGFSSPEEMKLVLLHPVQGFFRDARGGIGGLRVWHPEITPALGAVSRARFEPLERLGLLTPEEALRPAAVFLSPSVPFRLLPGGLPTR